MKNIIDFGLYKDTLNKSQRVETTKRRDDKINFIKIKNHCSSKDSILVVGWKKIFAICILIKDILGIHKEL